MNKTKVLNYRSQKKKERKKKMSNTETTTDRNKQIYPMLE